MITSGKIVAGPGKFDLMNALFIGQKVMFTVKVALPGLGTPAPKTLVLRIDGIATEDGTRESWNIEGYVDPEKPDGLPSKFQGHYHSTTRQGHVEIVDHTP